jgi:hypothetical protein
MPGASCSAQSGAETAARFPFGRRPATRQRTPKILRGAWTTARIWRVTMNRPERKGYQFTLTLDGPDELTTERMNRLFETGCDDATFGTRCGVHFASSTGRLDRRSRRSFRRSKTLRGQEPVFGSFGSSRTRSSRPVRSPREPECRERPLDCTRAGNEARAGSRSLSRACTRNLLSTNGPTLPPGSIACAMGRNNSTRPRPTPLRF